ncbi:MAG: PAS domain S-box protein [Deltaproteobacteria bacterium]|nr:PAS domain S-box protein [Deltaproteobacteria bacterium]
MPAHASDKGASENKAVAEDTLDHLKAVKAAMLDAAPEPIIGVDSDGRIICWNAAAERIFGYSSTQARGQALVELIVPARLREHHLRGFGLASRGVGEQLLSRPIKTEALRSDDQEFPVEISVSSLRLNGAVVFVAHVRDLSTRHRREAELEILIAQAREAEATAQRERKRLQDVYAASPNLVLVTEGASHHIRFATPSAFQLFRVSPESIGKPLVEVYPEFAELGYLQLFTQVYETGEVLNGREIPLTNRGWGDTVRYFDYTFQPIRDEQGRITGVVAHGIEVTDQVMARRRLEQALHARDDFVSLVSHELRNPLNVLQLQIAGTTARLNSAAEFSNANFVRERLAAMDRTMALLAREFDRLLEVSRMVHGPLRLEPEQFDLGALAQEVIREMASESRGCETVLDQDRSLRVTWDRRRIAELMTNLLSNAYKYGVGKPVCMRLEESQNSVRVEVRDQGAGIPVADQQRIFERFERAQARPRDSFGGLGVGLWICQQIVAAHGGRIWVESALASGSRFIAELPCHINSWSREGPVHP